MPIQANGYYSDPTLAAGIENLGYAIFGDPNDRIRRAQAVVDAQYTGARTRDAVADAARKEAQLAAAQRMGSQFGDVLFGSVTPGGPRVPRAPEEVMAAIPDLIGTGALAYDDAGALGEIFRLAMAASGDDALARRGMVATGVTPGEEFALTPERADNIRAQGFQNDQTLEGMKQAGATQREYIASGDRRYGSDRSLEGTRYSADQSRAGAMERERLQEEGRMERRYDTPLEISPAATALLTPDDPRIPQGAVQADGFGALFTAPPAPAGSGGGVPLDISPSDIKALRDEVITQFIPSGAEVAPEDVSRVLTRAAEIYQQTRNVQGASAQAWQEIFGANPTVQREGGFGGLFGTNRVVPAEPAAPAAPASGSQPPAADVNALPAAPQDPAQRAAGQVYQTPRGPMVWTGTGWRPVT